MLKIILYIIRYSYTTNFKKKTYGITRGSSVIPAQVENASAWRIVSTFFTYIFAEMRLGHTYILCIFLVVLAM